MHHQNHSWNIRNFETITRIPPRLLAGCTTAPVQNSECLSVVEVQEVQTVNGWLLDAVLEELESVHKLKVRVIRQ